MAKRRGVWIRPLKIDFGARNGAARSVSPPPIKVSAYVRLSDPATLAPARTPPASVPPSPADGARSSSVPGFSRGGSPDWSGPCVPTAHGGNMSRLSGSIDSIRLSSRIPPTPSTWEWWAFMYSAHLSPSRPSMTWHSHSG